MEETSLKGIFIQAGKLYTRTHPQARGIKIYNEHLRTINSTEYRSWNPYRSKLAAALLNDLDLEIHPSFHLLYLGAANGTTVSHLSDLLVDGMIYAVEQSPLAAKDLVSVATNRPNIIPLLADANHSDRYKSLVSPVDIVYQDISQRNQAEIFLENMQQFLKPNGYGICMIKARSIDVSLPPAEAYQQVEHYLLNHEYAIQSRISLDPYEKDHAALVVKK